MKSKKKNDVEMEVKVETDRNAHKCETLLEAMQDILEASENSQFDRHLYRNEEWAQYAFDYLHKRLGLTDEEAILTAIVLEKGTDRWASLSDISRHLGCSKIEVMQRRPLLASLSEKGYIVLDDNTKYGFSEEVLAAFSKNEVYMESTKTFDADDDLYMELHRLHTSAYNSEISTSTLHHSVDKLLECNAELPFAKAMAEYRNRVNDFEFRFFMAVTLDWLIADGNLSISDVWFIFPNRIDGRKLRKDLMNGKSKLITSHMIEATGEERMSVNSDYALTPKTKMSINPERAKSNAFIGINGTVLSSDSITKKDLFYSGDTDRMVADLAVLLKEKKMQGVLRRLKERNLRSGFTCLFYGGPGTGKTETVLQLSKLTGRAIYQVDYSQLQSKWVGESEKNVKAIFDEYRQLCNSSSLVPILLLNEADALIGKRMEGAERAVDKMENTIQNIVLQEMENFEGILIATTNLAGNMDTAFERRFLYKIEFEKPDTEARAKIWRSLLPSLNKKDAAALSEKFPRFAGGQIENITRKVTVDEVLHGGKTKFSDIVSFCEQETIGKHHSIGFQKR